MTIDSLVEFVHGVTAFANVHLKSHPLVKLPPDRTIPDAPDVGPRNGEGVDKLGGV